MRILVVSCHPDDAEIGCGGTIRRCVQRGDEVTICHVANGNMGHAVIMPNELMRIRAEEARAAGARLGAKEVVTLDVPDLMVSAREQRALLELVALIRRVRPDFIITHAPDDYMIDHIEAGRLAFDASFSATIPHFGQGKATSSFPPIYYMDTLAGVGFVPEQYVDVSDAIEIKLDAVSCHQSQVKWMLEHDHIDFLDMVRTCARYRGYQCGTAYAEGFRVCKAYPRMPNRPLLP